MRRTKTFPGRSGIAPPAGVQPGRGIIHKMRPSATPAGLQHPLDPILDFMRLLWSIEHGLQRISKRMKADLGITGPQRLVLRVVEQFPDVSAGRLAEIVRLHPSTITGILQRLVARGLLDRGADPADSRRARLRLKPRARRYTQTAEGTAEERVREALKRIRPADVRAARRVLVEIAQGLNVS